jgi:hypothetical protein
LFIHANDGKPSKHLSNPAITTQVRFGLQAVQPHVRWLFVLMHCGFRHWHDVKPSSLFIPWMSILQIVVNLDSCEKAGLQVAVENLPTSCVISNP